MIFMLGFISMTCMGALGAFFLKLGVEGQQKFSILSLMKCPWVYCGGIFYACGAIANIILLRFFDYTILYPMTAVTYIWTLMLSTLVLKEKLTASKILAVYFIIAGVSLLNIA